MELPRDQILLGDCLELLKNLPSDSIDACVSDVPYGLGNKDPGPDELFMFVLGGSIDMGGDFMGRDWTIPSISVWREVYRVLKPGGHVLAFGGTRTFDLISVGLRMAGFESRDTIAREFPILQWIQGQGMPKSHNVSVAIDKKLGKKREVVRYRPIAYPDTPSGYTSVSANSTARKGGIWNESTGEAHHGRPVTAPVSDEAKQWEGWGSGLKPAWEPILVFRKPLKGTLASNVLEHGTGALNIDATRVRHASKEDFEAHKKGVDAIREKGGSRDNSWKNASDLSGANEVTTGGRWPSNVLLEHAPYAEWWRLRTDISEDDRQEALAYYGVEQAMRALRGTFLGNAVGSGEAEVLLEDVRGSVAAGTAAAEDDLGESGLPAVSDPLRGSSGLVQGRAPQVLLEEVPAPIPHRQAETLGQGSHAGSSGEDEGRRNGQVPGGELESMEGRTVYLRAGVRLRHDRPSPRATEVTVASDGAGAQQPEVCFRAPGSGSGDVGAHDPKGRGRASRKRAEGRQSPGEPRGRAPRGAQPSASGDREQGGDSRSSGGSLGGGELELEVRSDLVAEHLGALFYRSSTEGCRRVGVRRFPRRSGDVKGSEPSESTQGVYGKYAARAASSLGDADGLETAETWECAVGCPAAALDAQSGNRPSTLTGRADPSSSHQHPGTVMKPNSAFLGERSHLSKVYADNGGAARFFTQLGSDEGESWECTDGCPVKTLQEQGVESGSHAAGNKGPTNHVTGNKVYEGDFRPLTNNPDYHADEGGVDRFFSQFEAEGSVPFRYVPKANRKEAGCGEFEVEHITVKPLELMRWLVKLVTPKGGIVLDHYAGSGSTCHAAVLEGMHYVGMERHEPSHAEATRRMAIVHSRERERQESEAIFDFAMGGSANAEDELDEVL